MIIKRGKLNEKMVEVEIDYVRYPLDPRKNYCNMSYMVCWHKNYNLGDEHSFKEPAKFDKWLEKKTAKGEEYVCVPLYLYDHSGITISTTPFHCPWDSGQVGWAVIFKEQFKDKTDWELKAKKQIIKEVKEYDSYITGNVFVCQIFEVKKCECCGKLNHKLIDEIWEVYEIDEIESWLKEIGFEQEGKDIERN